MLSKIGKGTSTLTRTGGTRIGRQASVKVFFAISYSAVFSGLTRFGRVSDHGFVTVSNFAIFPISVKQIAKRFTTMTGFVILVTGSGIGQIGTEDKPN